MNSEMGIILVMFLVAFFVTFVVVLLLWLDYCDKKRMTKYLSEQQKNYTFKSETYEAKFYFPEEKKEE